MLRVLKPFWRRFIPQLADHLSDDRMASLFCQELPFFERQIVNCHLAQCWPCRVRLEDLKGRRANEVIEVYRAALRKKDLLLSPRPRAAFIRKLENQVGENNSVTAALPQLSRIVLFGRSPRRPMLISSVAFSLTCVIAALFWWPHRALGITPNVFLANAQQWDTPSHTDSPGVLYQEISIRTERQQVKRSIYRDLQGKRLLKPVKLNEGEESLKSELTQAGIDWETPISATGYQAWHDHQPRRADKIARAGKDLLRLTTTVSSGSVAEQSLTVRDTDFHPVRRTVASRDLGTVEIAELDFKILPWSAVDPGVFEPLDHSLSPVATNFVRTPQLPHAPEGLSPMQLDEAELGARLILNQLHADAGEQIEIHRVSQGITVEGIVETDERKHELQARLSMVPHLTVSVQSVTDVKNKEDLHAAAEIRIASVVDRPSPLETSLQAHGRTLSDLNGLAQQIFNTALTISQECKAIVDLQTQFHPGELRPVLVAATLSELLYSHRERLRTALKRERQLIATAEITPASIAITAPPKMPSLLGAADKNLSLSRELTQASDPHPRSAEQILADMSISIDDLTAGVREPYGKTLGSNTPSGKN